ncbi:PepSY-associated TM helix domain-containing protein [Poseidonibacter antarcticus]|uniref:PepSY-associated TM helix domain-containing protein n=1 Tax=Poseidonibacter antarcticus TaxID=2478538 RepID=UPI000EF45E61|nr:PepSY-associated TM helix domain-containing protein [Poseidonibacter antarcticus]
MHKKVWFKIHWFLGITAGIILLIIGTTGAIMSFEKEILKIINKDSYIVSISDTKKLSTTAILEKFQENMPKSKINRITFSNDASSSIVINIAGKGKGKAARKGVNYFVNPYTAEVLPDLKGKDFFSFVKRLHRWLAFTGDAREVGKQIVAISTVSLIVLMISAIIIYWGRIKRSFFKSFTFSTKHNGRAFISTMHSAVGMWVIPFYLTSALTGLYWSYSWYNTALYKITGVEKPKRGMSSRQNKPKGEKISFTSHEKAITMFNDLIKDDYSKATISLPKSGTVYTVNYLDVNPAHYRARNTLQFDISNNKILKNEKYEEKPLNEKVMSSFLQVHTGEFFGVVGQTAMFITSSLMSLFTITGFMLYFNRKKKKKSKIK